MIKPLAQYIQHNRAILIRLIVFFILWQVGLFSLSIFADSFLEYKPSFPYATTMLPTFELPRWIYSFANFDGVHYLTIAREGYLKTNYIQAFFPLYPFVVLRGLFLAFGTGFNLIIGGLFVSNLAFFGALLTGFELVRLKFNEKVAWHFVVALLLFPTSLFFGALYTESLFLLLVFATFLSAHHKKWWLAGFFAALASSTRIVGIFLVPALFIELLLVIHDKKTKAYLNQESSVFKKVRKDWIPAFAGMTRREVSSFLRSNVQNILWIFLGSAGLLAYMCYLNVHFSDPLYFFHVQSEFGAGRSETLVIYPQVVWRAIKILLTSPFDLKYVTYLQEFIAGTLGLLAILFTARKVPISWTVFALFAFFVPTLSGSFLSMGRMILACFPIFVAVALLGEKNIKVATLLYAAIAVLLLLNTVLFVQGYWVA